MKKGLVKFAARSHELERAYSLFYAKNNSEKSRSTGKMSMLFCGALGVTRRGNIYSCLLYFDKRGTSFY